MFLFSFFLQQQYEFLYHTIATYLQCGITVINAQDLPATVQRLSIKNPQTKLTGFEQQLKVHFLSPDFWLPKSLPQFYNILQWT